MTWRRIGMAVLLDLAILCVAELGIRTALPVYARMWSDRDHTFGMPKRHRGYPDEAERLRAPPDGRTRVAFFGDSVTFGWGLAVEETIPARVEAALEARDGDRWTCVNMSGMGTSPILTAEVVESEIGGWNLDAMVYQLNLSDIGEDPVRATPEERAAVMARREALGALPPWLAYRRLGLYGLLTVESDRVNYLLRARTIELRDGKWRESTYWKEVAARYDTEEVREGWARQIEALSRIDRAARSHDVPLLVILLPYAFDVSDRWLDDFWQIDTSAFEVDPFERFGELAEAAGLRHAVYVEPVRAARAAHPNTPFYFPNHMNHFTAAGIDAFAPALAEDVRTLVGR